jgi:Zn-dependent M28 family amino/carboxypeptidase
MTLADAASTPAAGGPLAFRFNPSAAEDLFAKSGHTYKELLALAAANKPLPRFKLGTSLRAKIKVETAELSCNNVLGVLPGGDPELSKEYVVVSAHLDGYGVGEAWNGDNIYNGAFDDAAYVATLIDMAERLHASGKRLKRSLLFAVVTAEEKGLLGSRYFIAHPTVPKDRMVANVNLDQLRPIFPLKTLTTLALEDSTLGDTVRQVAAPMGIKIQPDPEPGRNLLRRSDHWNFMQIGVPAVGFIFGYENNTPEEAIYRRWYLERYHSPADDLKQPWDPAAADKFNVFFGRVVAALADAPLRPQWKAGSPYAAK